MNTEIANLCIGPGRGDTVTGITELEISHVISTFCTTNVQQNAKITENSKL